MNVAGVIEGICDFVFNLCDYAENLVHCYEIYLFVCLHSFGASSRVLFG